ncbi:hypothetical protein AB6A40_008681 [Gnathostoma spinigerum]|uniref:EF-hand domain-containing protein n=1 Tax=Gnathostoma spinigerum TaxID=75299 RepID=A0ABD6ES55_9BILA
MNLRARSMSLSPSGLTILRNSGMSARSSKQKVTGGSSNRATLIAEAIKSKFYQDHSASTRKGSNFQGVPLITHKLSTYTDEELKDYRQVFDMFDTDRSGAIGLDELENAMRNLGIEPMQGELEEIIEEADQIGNHEIDFNEFCDVMKRLNAKQRSWNEVTRECFAVFDRVS